MEHNWQAGKVEQIHCGAWISQTRLAVLNGMHTGQEGPTLVFDGVSLWSELIFLERGFPLFFLWKAERQRGKARLLLGILEKRVVSWWIITWSCVPPKYVAFLVLKYSAKWFSGFQLELWGFKSKHGKKCSLISSSSGNLCQAPSFFFLGFPVKFCKLKKRGEL